MKNKILLVGTGIMADIYADIIACDDNSELVATVGNSKANSKKFSKRFSVPVYSHGDIEGALRENIVNFAIITTPEWVRKDPIKILCEHNLPILLEKPFAASLEDCNYLEKCLEGGKNYFNVCHVLRSSQRFQRLASSVSEGEIGKIKHIYARRNSNQERVKRVLGKFPLTNWLLPHDLDLILELVDSDVTSVYSSSSGYRYNSSDYIISIIKFANGVTANVENSWASPPISNLSNSTSFEVFGDRGKIELDDDAMNVRIFNHGSSVVQPDTYEHYPLNDMWRGYFFEFLSNVLRNHTHQSVQDRKNVIEKSKMLSVIQEGLELSRQKNEVVYI